MPFPQPTTGRYLPGAGYALTRANLAWALKQRLIDPSDGPEQVATKFQPYCPATGRHCEPDNRHVYRARLLMDRTPSPTAQPAA